MNSIHIATRTIDGTRYRYSFVMNNRQFESTVVDTLHYYGIGGLSGWKFTHIPADEFEKGSKRVDVVMALPPIGGDIEDDLLLDILHKHPNHHPCCFCKYHTASPPRGELAVGYIPPQAFSDGKVFKGYICDQCADDIQGLRWL